MGSVRAPHDFGREGALSRAARRLEPTMPDAHSCAKGAPSTPRISPEPAMTQTTNRFLDEFAKLMTDAAGAADGLRKEAESLFKSQGERFLREMDVVRREEFEAVKAMAEKARAENERLETRIAALEAQLRQGSV
jgi:BMFP domain-containing protein YqiC